MIVLKLTWSVRYAAKKHRVVCGQEGSFAISWRHIGGVSTNACLVGAVGGVSDSLRLEEG